MDEPLIELCLQHRKGQGTDETSRAYNRAVRLEERRELMIRWEKFAITEERKLAEDRRQDHDLDRVIAEAEGGRMSAEEVAKWSRFDCLEGVEEEDR